MLRFTEDTFRLDDLVALGSTVTELADYPLADSIVDNVVIYDAPRIIHVASTGDEAGRTSVLDELIRVFASGPGIAVFRNGFEDHGVIDRVSQVFREILTAQQAAGHTSGDHYAKPGANGRIWNALEKLAVADPDAFVAYYANEVIALASEAWLGRGYQMTSQVNVVYPGGEAQRPHRDYHLGFLSYESALRFPAHVHGFSAQLTLQGAVAHCDMPLATGPTTYLPHSQKLPTGYLAFHRGDVGRHYADHCVQLALRKGDVVFFNPAVLHAAGTNRTVDVDRMANLLQVSSAFGRAMETVDRDRVVGAIYPSLVATLSRGRSSADLRAAHNALACAAEGYAFPTNLDLDPPVGGIAPPSSFDRVWDRLMAGAAGEEVVEMLGADAARRRS